MKTKILVLSIFIGFCTIQLQAQNLIGMSKSEVMQVIKKAYPSFDIDGDAKNTTYKYLKYIDKYNEETMLVFLSDDDVCTFTKLMSDYSNEKIRTDELDKKYKKTGDHFWTFVDKGENFTVELKKEEWYFTIITKKKK
jgi:hypothetical protein